MIVSREALLDQAGSVYKLVNLAARRAMQLGEGEPALVEADAKMKPALVALQEILEGKVKWRLKAKEKEKEKK